VLGARHSDRNRKSEFRPDAAPDRLGDFGRRTEEMFCPRDVGKGLVDGDALDQRREVAPTELLAARIFPANLQFAGRFSEIAGRADPIWLSNCLISQDFGRNSRDLRSRERFWGIAGKVLGIAGKILGNCREKSSMQLRMVAGFGAHGEQG
jgi:hypothetical protein